MTAFLINYPSFFTINDSKTMPLIKLKHLTSLQFVMDGFLSQNRLCQSFCMLWFFVIRRAKLKDLL